MENAPSLSLVICTYNRPNEVMRLLQSIDVQTVEPLEVLVIDASDPGRLMPYPRCARIAAPKGLTVQRNIGLNAARDEVVVFVDDDAILTPRCLEAIQRAFLQDDRIGAVTGRIIADDNTSRRQRSKLSLACIFGLGQSNGNGRFKLSGFPSLPSWEVEGSTEVLFGGLMAFRAQALREVGGFDEHLTGYGFMEDQDIAARIRAAGWEMRYLPGATFYHKPAPGGRDDPKMSASMKVINSRYLLEKNFRPGICRRAAWWWAMVGLCLVETRAHGLKGLHGVLLGLTRLLVGRLQHAPESNDP